VAAFEKEIEVQTKKARMRDAEAQVEDLEVSLKVVLEACEPFLKGDAANMSEADAEKPLEVFAIAEEDFQTKAKAASVFLQARQAENKGKLEEVKKLQERISEAKKELEERRKPLASHEQTALVRRLAADAKEQVGLVDAEVEKATAACSGFLENNGEDFLVRNSIQLLAEALSAHLEEKKLTVAAYFKTMSKGKPMAEKAFVTYLTALGGETDHAELGTFSDERRTAIFKSLAKKDKVSQDDFAAIFRQDGVTVRACVLTDKFEMEGCETVCKLEPQTALELVGLVKEDASGLERTECKVGDKTGWITIKQDKIKFVTTISSFKRFSSDIDKLLMLGTATVGKKLALVSTTVLKLKNMKGPDEGPLKEAREGVAELKTEVSKGQLAISALRAKVQTAKNTHTTADAAEKAASVEIRNKKEAAIFLEGPSAIVAAMEANLQAIIDAAAPLTSLSEEKILAFTSPATIVESVNALVKEFEEKATEGREAIQTQVQSILKVNPQNGATLYAKAQLYPMRSSISDLCRQAAASSMQVTRACKTLVDAKLATTSEAIRKYAGAQEKSAEELFDSLAEGDKMSEEDFVKLLSATDGPALEVEVAQLLCRSLQADGISKATFTKYACIYYKVLKSTTFTEDIDLGVGKAKRKGEVGEILELLEGPVTDEKGLNRIRARSTKDTTRGWITVTGNNQPSPTVFLQKTTRP